MTKKLTVNLGLRVSLFGTYHEKNRNAWNWGSFGDLTHRDLRLTQCMASSWIKPPGRLRCRSTPSHSS